MSDDPRDAAWLAGKRVAAFLAEMNRFEATFRGGNPKALKRAVELCGRYDMPLPPWVRHAVLARLDEAPRPKGTPTKMDVHVIRWSAVCELRERRKELKDPPITSRPVKRPSKMHQRCCVAPTLKARPARSSSATNLCSDSSRAAGTRSSRKAG